MSSSQYRCLHDGALVLVMAALLSQSEGRSPLGWLYREMRVHIDRSRFSRCSRPSKSLNCCRERGMANRGCSRSLRSIGTLGRSREPESVSSYTSRFVDAVSFPFVASFVIRRQRRQVRYCYRRSVDYKLVAGSKRNKAPGGWEQSASKASCL